MDTNARLQRTPGTEFGAPQEFKPYDSTPPLRAGSAEPTPGQAHTGTTPTKAHGWMHWLMCLPMVAIIAYLVLTGAVGGGAILYALGCMAMMGVMMLFMNHGSGTSGHRH
ncbi:hypothetical protein [Propioniciclava tarda]|uniref:DUF2933 domain-containing protein n=1 Tax=Propioniciclava tarda TaxID=433330 RepID=A0A4Q9KIC3_PROTD|nr:hypothetical protein [Propioniciclava tarda]TBT93125.1 hypothetical protein ET996_12365 [Propioniciclava tarda]SMO77664.1 hypothetical protein SAMN06266982_11820 [Propioniciclava tarda]